MSEPGIESFIVTPIDYLDNQVKENRSAASKDRNPRQLPTLVNNKINKLKMMKNTIKRMSMSN